MNEEFKELFSNLSEKDQKEVANLIRFKNEVKYHDKEFEELLQQYIELSREHDKLQNNWNELKEIEKEHQKINGELREENKKLKEVIEEVRERLEYYLIGNMKYEDSQKEFKKLLQILDKVKEN
jgi:aspartate oxidase